METLSATDEKYVKGWSWGAFFGTWIFLFINKQNKLGWKILAIFIFTQLVNFIPSLVITLRTYGIYEALDWLALGIAIWLGIKGRQIVWKSGVYASVEEFQSKQPLVTKLAIILFILEVALIIYSAISSNGSLPAN